MLFDQEASSSPDLKISAVRVGINDVERYSAWLEAGYHGTMSYLSRNERILKINDPSLTMEGAKSIVIFMLNYRRRKVSKEGYGRVASYAGILDYHYFFPKIIDDFMVRNGLFVRTFKTYVDTGPLNERDLSRRSSLGWIGRNSMLINPVLGSFTFLGASVTDLAIDIPSFPPSDLCGTCNRCITSCPTGAINSDRTVDSNLCISYQTIENRGAIPRKVSDRMEDMIFGCDICNDVCPWNREKRESSIPEATEDRYSARMKLEDMAFMDTDTFNRNYGKSPMKRATHAGLARNAIVALFNSGREDVIAEVSKQFDDVRKKQADLLLRTKK